MATYKLIQDIEADDHILGPLTLRQFVFALVTAFLLYIDFILVVKGAAFLLIGTLPPTLLTGFFAAPFAGDQPTEIWALAKIRFLFKPHQRLWNQTGLKDMVTITAPKKVEHNYTDGLSQVEVKSRLKALATTIDTRGWAAKNLEVNAFTAQPHDPSSDRLVTANDMQENLAMPEETVPEGADVLDQQNSPLAQQFDQMIDQSNQARRQALMQQMEAAGQPAAAGPAQPAGQWFSQPTLTAAPIPTPTPVASVEATAEEEALIEERLKQQATAAQTSFGNMHALQPVQPAPAATAAATDDTTSGVTSVDPAILSLANNNDLSVATLGREARKNMGNDEVVVALH